MPVHQWLKREKMSIISSFVFAVSVFEGLILGQTTLPSFMIKVNINLGSARLSWKHKGTNLSDKVLCSRVATSHCSCFLFACLSWRSKKEKVLMCLCTGLEAIFWFIHVYRLITQQKLTQQSYVQKYRSFTNKTEAQKIIWELASE